MAQDDQNSAKAATDATVESAAPELPVSDSTPLPPEKLPPASPNVTYTGELLKIDAFNSTLADILAKIVALTGASIDVPAGARGERMVADLGPGPPRQILTSLLTDTDFDFVIISSKDDPYSILTVVLTPRGHNSGSNARTVLAEHSPMIRRAPAEATQGSDDSADNQQENDSATAGSENTGAEAASTAPATDSPIVAGPPAPVSPAPTRSPEQGQTAQQSMNQQMLQMYKQREQQIQEQRASAHQANP